MAQPELVFLTLTFLLKKAACRPPIFHTTSGSERRLRLRLDHDGRGQHGQNSRHLQRTQDLKAKSNRKQDREHRLKATCDDGACGIEILQSAEIEHVWQHHGEAGKNEEELPLPCTEM